MHARPPAIKIVDLDVHYQTSAGSACALSNINLEIAPGERVGLVGESGCGKSTLLKSIMGVLPSNGRITRGAIELAGRNLLTMSPEQRRKARWADVSMITQSALNALNPVQRVGEQIVEAVRAHRNISNADAKALVSDLFELVGVNPSRADDYPHQFSGGMRQRAVIAMALALSPPLIVADEPTTALDVIVQDQIFFSLRELQSRNGFALVLVTHDLALVVENCQKTLVMYAGMIVESASTRDIVKTPKHPYTIGLINAVSVLGAIREPISIPGSPPDLHANLHGCRFTPRCPLATQICHETVPPMRRFDDGHSVLCHHWQQAETFAERAKLPETWQPQARADA